MKVLHFGTIWSFGACPGTPWDPQSGSGDDARLLFPIWTNLAIGPRLKLLWPDCFGLARLVPDCSAWLSRAWLGRAPLGSVLLQLASTRPTSVWTGRGLGNQRSTKLPWESPARSILANIPNRTPNLNRTLQKCIGRAHSNREIPVDSDTGLESDTRALNLTETTDSGYDTESDYFCKSGNRATGMNLAIGLWGRF